MPSEHTHTIIPCLCRVDRGTASAVIGSGPMCCVELFLAGKCPKHEAERELLAQDSGHT